MTIKCIKTGANVYVDPWNAWIHGDVYETRDETVFVKWFGDLIKDKIPARWHYCFHTWEMEWGADQNKVLVANKGQYWKGPHEGSEVVTAERFYNLKGVLDGLCGRRYRFYVTDNLEVQRMEDSITDGKTVDIIHGRFLGGI